MSEDFYLTPHFKISELSTTNNSKYKTINLEKAKEHIGKMYMLAGFAERVREIVGKPLIITSGLRCKQLNDAVGGSPTSQHVKCEAIDFIAKGLTSEQIAKKLANSDLKFQQLIIETSNGAEWVHISIGSKQEILKYRNGKYIKMETLA